MNKLDLEEIRRRSNAATEGPWVSDKGLSERGDKRTAVISHFDYDDGDWYIHGDIAGHADAEFIAHARQDVPALIAEVERLQKSRDWYDGQLYSEMNRSTTYYDEMKRLEEKCKKYESLAQEYDYYAIIEAIEEDD
jgi:hypothetical protein